MLLKDCSIRAAACLAAWSACAWVVQPASAAVTGGFSVDITHREEVRSFYNAVYARRASVRSEWTGRVSECLAGDTSQAYKDAVLTRLNFYRAMIGVPASVTFRADYSLRAAEAALIMSANDEISHFPEEGWICFSSLGAEGADNSNLALGSAGTDAIDAYIVDAGPNYRVGHRRWVVYPKTQVMGTGDIDPPDGSDEQRANSLWIFDDHFGDPRPKTRESFVAWPPPGYVPHTLVYPRWSFQISGANFTNAVVTVSSNGVPLPVHKEKVETGYGENAIVFVPHGIAPQARMFWPKPAEDIRYSVQIENIVLRGSLTNYAYDVIVFDPQKPAPEWASVQLTGSANPPAQRLSRYSFPSYPNSTGYDFRRSRLENYTHIEGAEEETPEILSWVSGLYPLVQTNIAASGASAFQLAHSKPPRPQWLMLSHSLVPSAQSELRFKSRLGGATAEQIARVEVSLDEGSSWREIYAQAGTGDAGESAFADRVVSLARFAGRAIWVRFNYGFIYGPVSFARGSDPGIGWYIDDIEITGARRLASSEIQPGSNPSFEFIPPEPGEYYLDARARFFQEYLGEWSSGLFATSAPPEPPRIAAGRLRQKNQNDLELEFTATSLPPGASLRVERAATLKDEWQPDSEAVIVPAGAETAFKATFGKGAAASGFYRIVAD